MIESPSGGQRRVADSSMPKTIKAPTGVSMELLRAIAQGTVAATDLARELQRTKGRISQLATELIQAKLLRKNGAKYGLTKHAEALISAQPDGLNPSTQKFRAQAKSPNASRAAPVKDPQADDQAQSQVTATAGVTSKAQLSPSCELVQTGSEIAFSEWHRHPLKKRGGQPLAELKQVMA